MSAARQKEPLGRNGNCDGSKNRTRKNLSADAEFAYGKCRHFVRRERVAIFVAYRHDVLDDIEEVAAKRHAIDRVLHHAVFAPETMRPDAKFTAHRIATGIAFQAYDQQAFREQLEEFRCRH